MEKFDIEKINAQLERCANPQKETWSRGIICTQMPMLVVKSCDINAIVKSIAKDDVVPYLDAENFKYYENTIVYAKILHKVRDFQLFKHYLGKLLPIMDNWATVDSIIWQVAGKTPPLQVQFVQGTNASGHTSELDFNEVCEVKNARLQVQSVQKIDDSGCTSDVVFNKMSEKGKALPLQVQSAQGTSVGKCANDFMNATNLFELSKSLLVDERTFARRAGVRILFKYLDAQNIDCVLSLIKTLKNEKEYYVNMCVAWLLCDSFIKQREKTLSFLTLQNVNEFVFHKTISKCCDSFRVSATDKTLLRNLLKNI